MEELGQQVTYWLGQYPGYEAIVMGDFNMSGNDFHHRRFLESVLGFEILGDAYVQAACFSNSTDAQDDLTLFTARNEFLRWCHPESHASRYDYILYSTGRYFRMAPVAAKVEADLFRVDPPLYDSDCDDNGGPGYTHDMSDHFAVSATFDLSSL